MCRETSSARKTTCRISHISIGTGADIRKRIELALILQDLLRPVHVCATRAGEPLWTGNKLALRSSAAIHRSRACVEDDQIRLPCVHRMVDNFTCATIFGQGFSCTVIGANFLQGVAYNA